MPEVRTAIVSRQISFDSRCSSRCSVGSSLIHIFKLSPHDIQALRELSWELA